MNTLLIVLQKEIKEVLTELKSMKETYVPKADCQTKCTLMDRDMQAIWKHIDEIKHLS